MNSEERFGADAPETERLSRIFTYDQAWPGLMALDDREKIVYGQLPNDDVVFPGGRFEIYPYVHGSFDVIMLDQDGSALISRLSIGAEGESTVYHVTVSDEDGSRRPASPEEENKMSHILRTLNDAGFASEVAS